MEGSYLILRERKIGYNRLGGICSGLPSMHYSEEFSLWLLSCWRHAEKITENKFSNSENILTLGAFFI